MFVVIVVTVRATILFRTFENNFLLSCQVDKLRTQAAEQAEVISSQESELSSKKEQLEQLKAEETRLEQLKNDNS